MKYLMPRVYRGMLDRAKSLYDEAVVIMGRKKIVTRGAESMSFLKVLSNLFSSAGQVKLGEGMAIKEDPPRSYPLSQRYNEFIASLDTDITSVYNQVSDMDRAVKSYHNYSQAYKGTYNNIISSIDSKVKDIGMLSTRGNTNKFHIFRSDFTNTSSTYISTSSTEGILRLSASATDDFMRVDNIESMTQNASIGGRSVVNAIGTPYYGKRFGVIDSTSDDAMRKESTGNWQESALVNLLDTDAVGTYWEVEYTQRMDTLTNIKPNYGARYFISKGMGIQPSSINLTIDSPNGTNYTLPGAIVMYQSTCRPYSFFYNGNEPVPQRLSATISVNLKKPASINTISIVKKLVVESDIQGAKHEVLVSSVETWDGATWSKVPQFTTNYNYIVTAATTKTATGRRGSEYQPSVATRSRLLARRSGTSTPTSNPTAMVEAAPTILPNTAISNASPSTTWSFPTREGVLGIRVVLYTDYGYPIRYTMTKHKAETETGFFWQNRVEGSWVFLQYSADIMGKVNKEGAPIYVSSVYQRGLGQKKVDPVIYENRTYNVDPMFSDLYRWSIELSDITATGSAYGEGGTYISQVYESPIPIDTISLFSNHSYNNGGIVYSIKLESGDMYRIQPMEEHEEEDNGVLVPKILYINSLVPEGDRSSGNTGFTSYIDIGRPVRKFQVVINITRPPEVGSITPEVYDYTVKVRYKDEGGAVGVSRVTT
jgi:hypothetical protein